ncbi:hypothetical protein [Flavobacterium johnsoniae]|uniref:Guanylate cyclase domain-containing protein n=1 Tax=Flavobacterium johnsoniae TaxID=986 RepID=A0A1J7CK70_FLAJO|nr:hypothetical protein [Flavobacterium johnsoniae]OIV41996.1 hypothetical protein BKM63_10100 [Flavobacterium johnsoniae]
MEKILAYIDLLGFTKMIEKEHQKAEELLLQFYDIAFGIINDDNRLKGNISSDCLLVYSDNYSVLINCLAEIYRVCFLYNDTISDADFYLLPRGAVSVGKMTIGERDTSVTITKDFMIGKALVHSSKLEPQIKGSRLLIAVNAQDEKQMTALLQNKEINSVLYQNCTFKFWPGYQYVDALWFLDLDKTPEEQKKEVLKLLNIAIQLTKMNSKNSKIAEHYINTLRIGLLSYSKFVESGNDMVLQAVIKEFKNGKYWFLWLTVIEIAINCKNENKNGDWSYIQDFYKKVSLEKSWIYVIEEINKPEKLYLKKALKTFLA